MRLPRRVPWVSIAELEQVCSSIYTDENDVPAKIFAINRISAWRAVTSLPHAIESTLALLTVIVQDRDKKGSYPQLILRQSYASAILRMVNGLVDPLQVGTYARSIGSIAQQLGLPNWLVELRHAATHEDMPSIDLLREAARQSMAWLLHNYYLPILNPPPIALELEADRLGPLLPRLKFYKEAMKSITRDVSLVPKHKSTLTSVLRNLVRWISESKIAANVAIGEVGWASGNKCGIDADTKELWALEEFCHGLVDKGMIVPLSKKKRQVSDSFFPNKTSISLWEPLLQHVQSIHGQFPHVFCRSLVSILIFKPTMEESDEHPDPTYNRYLACWVNWTVETWGDTSSEYVDLRKNALSYLMKGLLNSSLLLQQRPVLRELLNALSTGFVELEALLPIMSKPRSGISKTIWNARDLDIMNERKHMLQAALARVKPTESTPQLETERQSIDILGWRILEDEVNWKQCPIGVFHSNPPASNTGGNHYRSWYTDENSDSDLLYGRV